MRGFVRGCASWVAVILFVGICAGPLLFLSIYVDVRGVVTDGVVVGKDEYISEDAEEQRWNRRLQIQVSYEPVGQSWDETTMIGVDAATYDQLHVGSAVRVRHIARDEPGPLSVLPIARLENQSTFSVFTTQPRFIQLALVLGIVEGMLLLIWSRVSLTPVRRLLLALLVVNGIAIAVLFSRPAILRGNEGPLETATATVRNVERITIASRSRRGSDIELLRPYDRVQLEFDPAGDVDLVVALDEIDPGSVSDLVVGSQVEVTYPRDNPRAARIVGASYVHRRLNWLSFPADIGVTIVIGIIIVIAFSFVGWLMKRLFTRLVAHRQSQP